MRVIVDAYGGDNAPEAVLQGCRMAADRWKCEIILTGDGEKLREKAAEVGADGIIIMNSQTSFEQRPGAIILDWSYVPVQTESSVSLIKYRAMAIKRR